MFIIVYVVVRQIISIDTTKNDTVQGEPARKVTENQTSCDVIPGLARSGYYTLLWIFAHV